MSEIFNYSLMAYLIWIHLAFLAVAPLILLYKLEKTDLDDYRLHHMNPA